MKIQIENLIAKMRGLDLTIFQKADALIEFNKLIDYVTELEKPTENPSRELIDLEARKYSLIGYNTNDYNVLEKRAFEQGCEFVKMYKKI